MNALDPQTSNSAVLTPAHIEQLMTLTCERLTSLVSAMCTQLDDTLFSFADRAPDHIAQARFFESILLLNDNQDGIVKAFAQSIENSFRRFKNPQPQQRAPQPIAHEALALVEQNDMDIEVAVTSMASRARSDNQNLLLQLSTRLSTYFKGDVPDVPNPLEPKQIIMAFVNAIEQLPIDQKVKLIALKEFERHVLKQLSPVFNAANQLLLDANIHASVPEAKTGTSSKAAPKATPDAQPTINASSNVPPNASAKAVNYPMFNELSHLLSNTAPNTASENIQPLSQDQVLTLLSTLELADTHLQNGLQQAAPSIRQLVTASLDKNDSKPSALSQVDDNIINLVDMMFAFLLDEQQGLPAPIAALIGRMQLPMVKLALLDHSLFDNHKHPARLLLNEMTEAARGWETQGDNMEDPLYRHIHHCSQVMCKADQPTPSLMAQLYTVFHKHYTTQKEESQRLIDRASHHEEGRITLNFAQEQVDEQIEWTIGDRFVPAAIIKFARSFWKKYLVQTHLRHGTHSSEWRTACDTLEDLIWSVSEIKPEDKVRWRKLIPGLGQRLRTGLETVSHSPTETDQILNDIWTIHRQLIVKGPHSMDRVAMNPTQKKLTRPTQAISPKTALKLQQLESLPVGIWLEFTQGDGRKLSCKLVRKINVTGDFVFTTRCGTQTRAINNHQLAHYLSQGSAKILSDVPLLDRALHAILLRLKSEQSAA